jgi:hypothetical protein
MIGVRRVFALAAVAACALAATPGALAATIKVKNTRDAGAGSLRSAMTKANDEVGFPGKDAIKITATGKINLESVLPAITSDMAIRGPGASALTVMRAAGAPDFRIFDIPAGATASISKLAVKKGRLSSAAAAGGGIRNAGTLTLKSAVVVRNQATSVDIISPASGGGILNTGTLTIVATRVAANSVSGLTAAGGGILNGGTLTLRRSTVDGNVGNAAIHTGDGVVTIENSTIAANEAIGLIVGFGTTTLRSTTIAANDGIPGVLANVYIVNNGTAVNFESSIVAKPPPGGQNCAIQGSPSVSSLGWSLASDASCPLTQPSDRQSKNPKLRSLATNGGPTPTMALPKKSPAVDRGVNHVGGVDQRNRKRPVNFAGRKDGPGGDGSDIGAFELQKK